MSPSTRFLVIAAKVPSNSPASPTSNDSSFTRSALPRPAPPSRERTFDTYLPGVYHSSCSEVEVRRIAAVSLFAVALILVAAVPSYAWGHGGHGFSHHPGFRGHGVVVFGPSFWWDPWWYYPPPYYYPPPQVVVQPAPVIVEEQPPQSYWYYCPSAKAYYPAAPTCPEVWIKVPPRQGAAP